MRLQAFLGILAVVIIVIAAAGIIYWQSTQVAPSVPTSTPTRKIKVALISGGDETDQGWASVGIKAVVTLAEIYPIDLSISRLVPFAQQDQVITQYAEAGYDVIITDGGQFISSVVKIAPQYPNTVFIMMAGANMTLPSNVVVLSPWFSINGMYLAGVLAGKMTKTNAVGVIMGQWYPYIAAEFYAFKEGVKSVNPEAIVYPVVAGTWGDAALGYQLAESLIKTRNVDIILHIADLTGRGVIAAAQNYGILVIGTCDDQAVLAPNNMLTSVALNKTMYFELIIKSVLDRTFGAKYGGKVLDIDISYITPFHRLDPAVPSDVKQLLKDLDARIKAGQIKVPRIITDTPPPPG